MSGIRLSVLNARIDTLEKRVAELEIVKGKHHTKRPAEWQGTGKAAELKEELERKTGELHELRRMKAGKWYTDDGEEAAVGV